MHVNPLGDTADVQDVVKMLLAGPLKPPLQFISSEGNVQEDFQNQLLNVPVQVNTLEGDAVGAQEDL